MRKLTTILLLLALVSCRSTRSTQSSHTQESNRKDSTVVLIKETVRYDTVRLPGGVVTVVQRVPCDSALLVREDTNQGRTKQGPDTTQRGHVRLIIANLGNGWQRIDCEADSLMAVVAAKDVEITTLRQSQQNHSDVKTVMKVVTKYRYPWWLYVLVAVMALWQLRNPLIELISKRLPWK
jgi:hypothetical protein